MHVNTTKGVRIEMSTTEALELIKQLTEAVLHANKFKSDMKFTPVTHERSEKTYGETLVLDVLRED